MRKYLKLDVLSLIVAAVGSLALSGYNTYTVMKTAGSIHALAAVAALEIGLVGLVLRISTKTPDGWLAKALQYVSHNGAPILVLLFLITTNVLAQVEIFQVAMSPRILQIVQVTIFGVLIPFLALMTLHAARDAVRGVKPAEVEENEPEEAKKLPTAKRRHEIQGMLDRGETLNQTKLAEKYGVTRPTIRRDIEVIQENRSSF